MSEPKIVEAVGRARVDVKKLLTRGLQNRFQMAVAQIHLVKKDAAGNVIEEKTVKYGDN